MSQAERDAIDIFGLLYPMLDDGQKHSSEARAAAGIAERYRACVHDSSKISAYDAILSIVNRQLEAERRDLDKGYGPGRRPHPSRGLAYDQILRLLAISHAVDDVRFDDGYPPGPRPPLEPGKSAPKPAAKKSAPRPKSK